MKNNKPKIGLIVLISAILLFNFINFDLFLNKDINTSTRISPNADFHKYIVLNYLILKEIKSSKNIYNINFPITTKAGNEPNLTRVGYPIVIK
ncbi:MAG: hypothetical protein ACFFCM_07595, partial [Promethearchaeota archaeon]